MATCSRCGKRKAKRACPALGGALCPLCCGTFREREIPCPSSCPHLSAHKPYQARRVMERTAAEPRKESRPGRPLDERMAWLVMHLETVLVQMGRSDARFTDKDAVLALDYARDKLAKPSSVLVLPGTSPRSANAAGETLLRVLETTRFEKGSVLTTGTESYSPAERLAAVDRVLLSIRNVSGESPAGRDFLKYAEGFLEEIAARGRDKRVIV